MAGLTPYLPLGEHLSDYYLFLPSAGLAIAGGLAMVAAWRAGWGARRRRRRCWLSSWLGRCAIRSRLSTTAIARSIRCRNLVTGLRHARVRHPDKTILLTSIDEVFFYASIYHDLFKLAGVWDVYLAPDANSVSQRPDRASTSTASSWRPMTPCGRRYATTWRSMTPRGCGSEEPHPFNGAYAPGRLATMLETE
ncbi:MAG: hypothetical protein R2748_03275 [Bryobacterales bacterium]